MSNYERDRIELGERGQEVFLRGPDVILRLQGNQGKASERNLMPDEAVALLEWLYAHRDELYQARRQEERSLETASNGGSETTPKAAVPTGEQR